MLLLMESFNLFGAGAPSGVWNPTNAVIAPSQGRHGTNALAIESAGTCYIDQATGTGETVVFQGALHMPLLATAQTLLQLRNNSGADLCVELRTTVDGKLELRDSAGALVATTANAVIVSGAWHYLEVKLDVGNSEDVLVRLDGTEIFNESGVDTSLTAATIVDRVTLCGVNNKTYWDDVLLLDSAAGEQTDWLGDCRISAVPLAADTSQAVWLKSQGTVGYELIDDPIPGGHDGDITYLYTADDGPSSVFLVDTVSPEGIGTVHAVLLRATVRADSGSPGLRLRMYSGGFGSSSTQVYDDTPGGTYETVGGIVELNPGSGEPWTAESLSLAAPMIFHVSGGVSALRCTRIAVEYLWSESETPSYIPTPKGPISELLGPFEARQDALAPTPRRHTWNFKGDVALADDPVARETTLLLGAQTIITPPQLGATETDYEPTGFDGATIMFLDPAGGGSTINGMGKPTAAGKVLKYLVNTSSTDWITPGGSGTYPFDYGDAIPPGRAAIALFDPTDETWHATLPSRFVGLPTSSIFGSKLQHWLIGGSNYITTSTGVSQWDDASGNALHATQGTSSAQPSYTEAHFDFDKRFVVWPDGSDDYMEIASFPTLSGKYPALLTVALFDDATAGGADQALVSMGESGVGDTIKHAWLLDSDDNWSFEYHGGATVHSATGIANDIDPHLFATIIGSGGSTSEIDGAATSPDLPGSDAVDRASDVYRLFCDAAATPGRFSDTRIAEHVVLDATPTAAELAVFEKQRVEARHRTISTA